MVLVSNNYTAQIKKNLEDHYTRIHALHVCNYMHFYASVTSETFLITHNSAFSLWLFTIGVHGQD